MRRRVLAVMIPVGALVATLLIFLALNQMHGASKAATPPAAGKAAVQKSR